MISPTFIRDIVKILAGFSIANAILGVASVTLFPVGFFANKTAVRIVSDLTFIEGAAIFFLGALLSFYQSKTSLRMIAFMVAGAAMLVLSFGLGIFG